MKPQIRAQACLNNPGHAVSTIIDKNVGVVCREHSRILGVGSHRVDHRCPPPPPPHPTEHWNAQLYLQGCYIPYRLNATDDRPVSCPFARRAPCPPQTSTNTHARYSHQIREVQNAEAYVGLPSLGNFSEREIPLHLLRTTSHR